MILGVLQGLTEFLPVSSSGHLVLGEQILGLRGSYLLFDLTVHGATLVATLTFFRRTVADLFCQGWAAMGELGRGRPLWVAMRDYPGVRLILLLAAGSIPTAGLGLLLHAPIEALFARPRVVAGALWITALLLLATRWARDQERDLCRFGVAAALLIGLAQGLALVPGISRSGSTIAAGLLLGIERELAARFSFLLAVPAIAGGIVFEGAAVVRQGATVSVMPLLIGFVAAAVTGFAALALLMPLVRKGRFYFFAAYLAPLGLIVLLLTP